MKFPELDENGTPKEKLPDCPRCEEDELGVIHPELLFCYNCGWRLMVGKDGIAREESGKVERYFEGGEL